MTIKVRAKAAGFYDNILRDPNDPGLAKFCEFTLKDESEFSADWMEKVAEEAPAAPAKKGKAPAEEPLA